MRVTHASVGATDAMAVSGDYLLHPFAGFVPGYDFVGIVERLPTEPRAELSIGQRVAGVLPGMGAHATIVRAAPSLLVPVPADLDDLVAATAPLDAVTARLALDALGLDGAGSRRSGLDGRRRDARARGRRDGSVLVQGAGGAVGAWAVQLARRRGLEVFGTASGRSSAHATSLGARVLDYRERDWPERLLLASGGGVSGAVDHTGGREPRRVVRPSGRIVRIAFGGEPGARRSAAARGALTAIGRGAAHPAERVCSTPAVVALRRAAYRGALAETLESMSVGELAAPRPRTFALDEYGDALAFAEAAAPGEKAVLVMP